VKKFRLIAVLLCITNNVYTQHYIRGQVATSRGQRLPAVKIISAATKLTYKSDAYGNFGFSSSNANDTLIFSCDGFDSLSLLVKADEYARVVLRPLPSSVIFTKNNPSVIIQVDENSSLRTIKNETYRHTSEYNFQKSTVAPGIAFSANINRASYSNIRRFITLNSFVPPDAVRIEEMINYFNLDYNPPEGNKFFKIKTTLSNCPWNPESQLFYINFSSKKLDLDSLPPSHLVFLIDVSGSMDMPNRLPLLKSAFRLLVNNLRDKDSVAIVAYGGVTGVMLNTISGGEKEKILKAIDELEPGGNTPGESGVKLAYSVAKNHFIKDGNNRVILATDGDFNVGMKTEEELDELISKHKESGIYLTCLGVGMGNYKDSKIQTLAKKGNGNFAYLDNFKEAEKVLLKEFTKTLYAVADDVYMNVDFNPEYVKEYRLIGFDNKVGALRDSLSIIEGGEIGSGHSMLALFEIVPTEINKGAIKDNFTDGKLAEINLQYQLPGKPKKLEDQYTCSFNYMPFEKLEKACHFSAAVAMFGSLLRNSPFLKTMGWNEMVAMAQTSCGKDDLLQKEFVELVQQAKILYSKVKKKRGG